MVGLIFIGFIYEMYEISTPAILYFNIVDVFFKATEIKPI